METRTHIYTTAATEVMNTVRSELRFASNVNTIDASLESGVTNCIGYTLLGSAALSAAGIRHYVGFVNGHATTVLPQNDELYLFDMLSPHLNQRIDSKMTAYQDGSEQKTVARIDRLAVIRDAELDYDDAVAKHPWLDSPLQSLSSTSANLDHRLPSGYSLIMSMFAPSEGRYALYHYAKFNEAYEARDIVAASNAISAMGYHFPDIDMRNNASRQVKSVVRRLAIAGDFERAHATTEAFFSGLYISHDTRVAEYEADCLRYIAQYSGRRSLAQRAIELYRRVNNDPRAFNKSISAKLRLCHEL